MPDRLFVLLLVDDLEPIVEPFRSVESYDTLNGFGAIEIARRGVATMSAKHEWNTDETQSAPMIVVRGAREHNLRGIDVDIPRDRFVVLAGVSGSGKSTLAFDVLNAEAQRRYIEGLSSDSRQYLEQSERPDVDEISGLPPTVSIDQKGSAANPRSTVATLTEIHDYLRLLYARAADPHCPTCDLPIRRRTAEGVVSDVLRLGEGRKVIILAPLARGRKGSQIEALQTVLKAGLVRARIDGAIVEVREDVRLDGTDRRDVDAVVDRLVVREGIRPRLAESVDLAIKLGDGTVILSIQTGEIWEDRILSTRFSCTRCGAGFAPLEPRSFSFNSPRGACPSCQGMGETWEFDPDLVLVDLDDSLGANGPAPIRKLRPSAREKILTDNRLQDYLKRKRVSRTKPFRTWSAKTLREFLIGEETGKFPGIIKYLDEALATEASEARRALLRAFQRQGRCRTCRGARLRPEALAAKLKGLPIHELMAEPISACLPRLGALTFDPPLDRVADPLLTEIRSRLTYLHRIGLGYLSLDRAADTLSGGELQRVRLASQLGSGLSGVCFILDEPTAGLHAEDTGRLLETLLELRDRGNSVVVVEHDEDVIRAADWVVDLGPGAGPDGGRLIAEGPPTDLGRFPESLTGRFLDEKRTCRTSRSRQSPSSRGSISIRNATIRNLRGVSVEIPKGAVTCVTGVSGSGKSTLVMNVLASIASRVVSGASPIDSDPAKVDGLEDVSRVVIVDQSTIGRGPRTTPATYTKAYDEIRRLFARTKEAKVRGYGPERFGFNVKGGRCEACLGLGIRRLSMRLMPELTVRCETCLGKRFNPQTLSVRFKGKSIGDVLEMRSDEAAAFFSAAPRIVNKLNALVEAGLGYVAIGRSGSTLSGGESQRVKLAAELDRVEDERALYLLDEPTSGLHFADVRRLQTILLRLAERGNTVVVIEHNLAFMAEADRLIDLGPDGGDAGGRVVFQGTPDEAARLAIGHTGKALARYLSRTESP